MRLIGTLLAWDHESSKGNLIPDKSYQRVHKKIYLVFLGGTLGVNAGVVWEIPYLINEVAKVTDIGDPLELPLVPLSVGNK